MLGGQVHGQGVESAFDSLGRSNTVCFLVGYRCNSGFTPRVSAADFVSHGLWKIRSLVHFLVCDVRLRDPWSGPCRICAVAQVRNYRREVDAERDFHVFVITKVWKRPAVLPKASLTSCSRQCQNDKQVDATEACNDHH